MPWFEVQEGELVLLGGSLQQLVQMWPAGLLPGQVGVRMLHEGKTLDHYVNSSALTAVRRYVAPAEKADHERIGWGCDEAAAYREKATREAMADA